MTTSDRSRNLDCRWFIDDSRGAALNMAIDQLLLHQADEAGQAALRFYFWSEPTLSLGYFQSHMERSQHAASLGRKMIRRSSGGGAILHDRELTYSLAVPSTHLMASHSTALYTAVHEALLESLSEFGVRASLQPEGSKLPPGQEPFLCFERRATGDVILAGKKIGGSAQRRRHGAVLQHGSVLLTASPFAPELPGIADLSGVDVSAQALARSWAAKISDRVGLVLHDEPLSPEELWSAESLADVKYGALEWLQRR